MFRFQLKILRKKLMHGNEFISVMEFCGNEGTEGNHVHFYLC